MQSYETANWCDGPHGKNPRGRKLNSELFAGNGTIFSGIHIF